MDEMKIESKMMTGLASKFLESTVRKKLNRNVTIKINSVNVSIDDNIASIHLDIDAKMPTSELEKVLYSQKLQSVL